MLVKQRVNSCLTYTNNIIINMLISTKNTLLCFIASLIRIWLINSEYQKAILDRVEISTPLNSWKRVTEGVYLLNEESNPYIGDLIHEPPLNLYIYKFFIEQTKEFLPGIFILFDICTALLLYFSTRKYLQLILEQRRKILDGNEMNICETKNEYGYTNKQNHGKKTNVSNNIHLFQAETTINLSPTYVFAAYLFNPYIILNCAAMTTTVFDNFFISLYIYALIRRKPYLSILSLAVSTTHTLYTAILILPVLLNLKNEKYARYKMIFYFILLVSFILGIENVCGSLCGSWKFTENTFGFILLIPDLQPNIGLFWYFFTEMFEHFRALFISAFQINAIFLYLIPLCVRFKKDTVMLASSLIILSTIFKSYPSLGDVGFCLALLPMWTHLVSYLQQGFFVSCCFLISTVLGPVVWHLWIYSRSANANFYFGVTLSFATAQIFLITDLLFAYIKIEFWLKNSHVRNTDSKTAKLTLE